MATIVPRGRRYRAMVRRTGHPVQTKTFATRAHAAAWALAVEHGLSEINVTGVKPSDCKTVSDLIDWYEKTMRASNRPMGSTQSGNLARLREGLGGLVAAKLSVSEVVAHASKRCSGQHLNGKGAFLPPCRGATMNIEIGLLSAIYSLGAAHGKVPQDCNPARVARPTLKVQRLVNKSAKRSRRPTKAELAELSAHFAKQAWRSHIPMNDIIDFAIGTARRQAEITRLKWSDIDDADRTITLRDAKHPTSKVGNHKKFPLLEGVWDLVQRQERKSEFIFPYESKSIGTAFTRACKDLGIVNLHFHDLRHHATSLLFENGYQSGQVMVMTGHASLAQLSRYMNIDAGSLHRTNFNGNQLTKEGQSE